MSRPVLPEPAGASTIQDWWMSSACSRSSASGGGGVVRSGAAACCWRSSWSSTRKSSAMGLLGHLMFARVFEVVRCFEGGGVEAAEQPLRAVLAGAGVALGTYAGVARVEVFGEPGEDATPLLDLLVERLEGKPGRLGGEVAGSELRGGVAVPPHLLAGGDTGERDGGERRLGEHGVERELRLVGALGQPVLVAGVAGLVVDEDVAGLAGVACARGL